MWQRQGPQMPPPHLNGMPPCWRGETRGGGMVEAEEWNSRRCLEVQSPYLGPVKGYYTDWTPLEGRPGLFPEDIDETDPWQFRNILVR